MNPKPETPASLPKKFPPAFPSRESESGPSVSPNASNPAADQSTSVAPAPFLRSPSSEKTEPALPYLVSSEPRVLNRAAGAPTGR